jgi:Arc/MetJ-type ribon-helix-helix transcriptional regulator
MEKVRISVRIDGEDFQKMQAVIKREYPALRSISDVVRAALKQFLSKEGKKE